MDQCIKNGKINGCHPTRFKLICGGHIHTYKRKNKGDKDFCLLPPINAADHFETKESNSLVSSFEHFVCVAKKSSRPEKQKQPPLFLTESLACPCHNNA
jgi:hypothetical protein